MYLSVGCQGEGVDPGYCCCPRSDAILTCACRGLYWKTFAALSLGWGHGHLWDAWPLNLFQSVDIAVCLSVCVCCSPLGGVGRLRSSLTHMHALHIYIHIHTHAHAHSWTLCGSSVMLHTSGLLCNYFLHRFG